VVVGIVLAVTVTLLLATEVAAAAHIIQAMNRVEQDQPVS
jgi:hypothetical protein